MINTSLFTTQSGDYSVITKAITANDAIAFGTIYQLLNAHALISKKIDSDKFYTILDYAESGIAVNFSDQNLAIAAIATLKAVGLIATNDNVHIGITLLGLGFYQFIQV